MRRTLLLFVIAILSTAIAVNLQVEFEWKYVDFVWDSSRERQQATDNGDYNAYMCILYDVDKSTDGRTFVTSVRDKGVPASLMTITDKIGDGGPLLRPYPDWSWHRNKKCEEKQIIGVYRVFIKCNHLFVLDTGKIGDDQICSAQLLIFNLTNDELVKRIIIPDNVATNKQGIGLLTTLTVSIAHCSNFLNDMVVFMSDTLGYGLVMYTAQSSKFCRIETDSMKPTDTHITINGQSFSLNDGIFGITLVKKDLYYAALAGKRMYKIDSKKIQECSLNQDEINQITQLTGTLSGQTAPIAAHKCAIFFSNIPETSILCADTCKKIDSNNTEVVMQDSVKLQFPSGMKIIKIIKRAKHLTCITNCIDHFLTILTNRYQRVATDTLNLNETNFRILSVNILEIQKTTHCFDSCT